MSIDVLRDAAPYGYVVVALLAGSRVGGADARSTLDRTGRALTCVLKFHAVWVLAATTSQVFANWHFPVNPAAVHIWLFQTRNDMDTMLLGVLASILVFRVLSGRRSGYPLLWLAVCLIGTLSTGSRAGLASAILLCCLSVVLAYRRGLTRNAGLISAALVPMFLIGMMAVLPQTDIGQRLAGTLGASADGSELGLGAAGTTEARKEAWVALYNYRRSLRFRRPEAFGWRRSLRRDNTASTPQLLVKHARATWRHRPHAVLLADIFGIAGGDSSMATRKRTRSPSRFFDSRNVDHRNSGCCYGVTFRRRAVLLLRRPTDGAAASTAAHTT